MGYDDVQILHADGLFIFCLSRLRVEVISVSLIPREPCHLLLRTSEMAAAISPAAAVRPNRCDAALCRCLDSFSSTPLLRR